MINEIEKEFEKLKKIYNEYALKEQLKLNKIDNNKFYKIENTQQLKYLVYKKSIIIENKQNLNIFTSKEIQDENKEITRNFQKEAFNYMNYEEETENENVAFFLIDVAKTSRKSYLEADKLFKSLFEKYSKSSQNKGISSLDNDKGKKEFSSWVKQYEKSNNIQENENSLKNEKKIFLSNLLYKLTKMYLHCKLSFPLVEISFEKEEMFNSEKMIDFINRGNNRKVNFVILPSLISNGNYLQNGKSWVFTYNKNTFRFDNSQLDALKKYANNNQLNPLEDLKLTISLIKKNKDILCIAKTNYEISKNNKCIYCFYLKDKKNNTKKISTEQNSLKVPKDFIIHKCVLIIQDKRITSNII